MEMPVAMGAVPEDAVPPANEGVPPAPTTEKNRELTTELAPGKPWKWVGSVTPWLCAGMSAVVRV
jgi:hypothetical protein